MATDTVEHFVSLDLEERQAEHRHWCECLGVNFPDSIFPAPPRFEKLSIRLTVSRQSKLPRQYVSRISVSAASTQMAAKHNAPYRKIHRSPCDNRGADF